MEKVEKLIHKLGIRSTYHGYYYLKYALPLCMENEDYLLFRGKLLYPEIAREYNTKKDNVEHCIRTIIDVCWEKGNKEFLIEIAGYPMDKRPSIGDFLDILVHYLKSTK